nr:ATP-binding protein [Ramlibacter albus]
MRESEARYRTLFDSMDEGFCIIEFFDGPHGPLSDYIHIEANPAYARHAGIPDVVGQKLREMVPDEADGWVALYGEVLRTGEPIRFERELVATGRHLELSAFRIEPPQLRQVAVLFQDVTAKRKAEAGLKQLNETLESRIAQASAELREKEEALRHSQKMEAVGQLTGGIAHDFNNLLTGIIGSLDLLQVRLQQGRTDGLAGYVTAARNSAQRAASLTHRLLAFSRRQALDARPTDVHKLVAGLQELVSRTVGPHIEVVVQGPADAWHALVDPYQLENALLNLCINARDAMPHGGRIVIAVGNEVLDDDAARPLEVEHGEYLAIRVTDTGAGMSPEVAARAFDPFFTTKPIGSGTGLGLSMVYGFARQSGGHAGIETRQGAGTTVTLLLPRHSAAAAEPLQAAPAEVRATAGPAEGTVLLVDDEPTVRMLTIEALRESGCKVIEAADGAAGLRLLQAEPGIQLLVTDVGLPGGMNGRQLADAARERRPGLPVIFTTGYAEHMVTANGQLPQGMQVLSKPFELSDLLTRVREALGR